MKHQTKNIWKNIFTFGAIIVVGLLVSQLGSLSFSANTHNKNDPNTVRAADTSDTASTTNGSVLGDSTTTPSNTTSTSTSSSTPTSTSTSTTLDNSNATSSTSTTVSTGTNGSNNTSTSTSSSTPIIIGGGGGSSPTTSTTTTGNTNTSTSTASSTTSSTTVGTLTAPIGLTASSSSSSSIKLSWMDGGTATSTSSSTTSSTTSATVSYNVMRNGARIATTTATSYTDTGLAANTTYAYNIAAVDASNNVSAWTPTVFATTLAGSITVPNTGTWGWAIIPLSLYNQLFGNGSSTPSSTPSSIYTYINGYPTLNGNYYDCNGNIDNDMGHHTTNPSDTDPAHHTGQNCGSNGPAMPSNSSNLNNMLGGNNNQTSIFNVATGGGLTQWVAFPLTGETVLELYQASVNSTPTTTSTSTP